MILYPLNGIYEDEKERKTEHLNQFHLSQDIKLKFIKVHIFQTISKYCQAFSKEKYYCFSPQRAKSRYLIWKNNKARLLNANNSEYSLCAMVTNLAFLL